MLLIVVNYKQEIDYNYFGNIDYCKLEILNENKGFNFALKIHKLVTKYNFDAILHFGLCGGKSNDNIGKIYKIDRTFLYYKDIIDNQRFRYGKYKFNSIESNNIVTKFNIGEHNSKLYDFADIFDIETFWVAQMSMQYTIPIFTIKGVSDTNSNFLFENGIESEINFLLNPNLKRTKKKIYFDNLSENILAINEKFKYFFNSEFLEFYSNISNNKQFKKEFYTNCIKTN